MSLSDKMSAHVISGRPAGAGGGTRERRNGAGTAAG